MLFARKVRMVSLQIRDCVASRARTVAMAVAEVGRDCQSASRSAAAYLLSDEARNVTATTLYVDSGYHAMGM